MRTIMRSLPLVFALGLLPASFIVPVALAADPTAAVVPADGVIAQAGGTTLKADEVRAWLETLPEADRAALAADPARLGQMVRLYLAQRLVLKEAEAKKFDQTPEVKAQLDRVRDTALSELYLASVTKVPDGYPAEAEVQAAYDANKTAFLQPRRYRLAQVYVAGAADNKDARGKLDAVQKALKEKGSDFGRVAAQFSDSKAEAQKGGEVGWIAETQLVPAIRDKVAGLPKDGVSEAVRTDDGWHVVKLLDTQAAGAASLADVKPALIERLRQAKAQQLRQAYLGQLLQKDPPVVNEMALSKLTPKK